MTIEQIFLRYDVDVQEQERAFVRASSVFALQEAWVGPAINWNVLLKAAIFCELGDPAHTRHIIKKVGLDKYTGTLIARAVPARLTEVLTEHDLHQQLLLFVRLRQSGAEEPELTEQIARNVLDDLRAVSVTASVRGRVSSIEVYHYKNPSV